MVCHDVLLSHGTWIYMHAKTTALIRLYRMRKWSNLHCSPAPNANGVSLLVRQYADSHDIYANWSTLFAEIDLNSLNQSFRLDCMFRSLVYIFAIIIYQILTVQYWLCFHSLYYDKRRQNGSCHGRSHFKTTKMWISLRISAALLTIIWTEQSLYIALWHEV